MRFLATLLLLAAVFLQCLAKPLPISMDEYERRWSQGESEVWCPTKAAGCYVLAWFRSLSGGRASIHDKHDIREATPAWPVARDYRDLGEFAFATDERTMETRIGRTKRSDGGAKKTPSLTAKMKAFVKNFYQKQGQKSVVGKRESVVEVEEAPVLKPRKAFRYHL